MHEDEMHQNRRLGCVLAIFLRCAPGVDVHAVDRLADQSELEQQLKDDTARAEVQEPLKECRPRQHGL